MQYFKKYRLVFVLACLTLASVLVWMPVISEHRNGILTVAFLDIGQGDAIYIEAPNGRQMMIDGGPGNIVLRALSKVVPFYDRSIDMLLISNPDQDHMAGFIDIVRSYSVSAVMIPGTLQKSSVYKTFQKEVQDRGIKTIIAKRGMQLSLSDGVRFVILFPDRDVSPLKVNDGSIVARLEYGSISVLFMGDSPQKIEKYLVQIDGEKLQSTVLKAGHHGSKTSTSPELVAVVKPSYAVISAGKDNKFGHPNKETLDTLARFGVPILETRKQGTIIMKTDGKKIWWNK